MDENNNNDAQGVGQDNTPNVCAGCGNKTCSCESMDTTPATASEPVDSGAGSVDMLGSTPTIEDPADANVCESCQ